MFKIIVSLLIIVGCILFLYNVLFENDGPLEKRPTEMPYIYHGVLYTSVKEISVKYVVYVELVERKSIVPFIIIHYQYPDSKYHSGMIAMSKIDYLKFRDKLLRDNIVEVKSN